MQSGGGVKKTMQVAACTEIEEEVTVPGSV